MSGSGSGPVTCPRCGTANSADDQFCGNCGTDLTAAALASAPPHPTPAAAPPTTPAAPQVGTAQPLVRCGTCGTANPATRSFCQKCGSKLAGAAPVSSVRPDAIAAAPAAPATPAAPPAAAAPARTTARRADPVDEGGGISSWLFIAAAGIVVGAIVVVIAVMSGSGQPPPPAGASAAPAASEQPSPSDLPSEAPSPAPSEEAGLVVTPVDTFATSLGTRRLSVVSASYSLDRAGQR